MEILTKEKTCAFYASDYHFEMISLPFIEKNIEENKEIIILTENNLEDTIKTLMKNINFNKNKNCRSKLLPCRGSFYFVKNLSLMDFYFLIILDLLHNICYLIQCFDYLHFLP